MANSNRNSTQRKNRHPNWPLRLILGAVFLSLLLTVVVVPLLQYRAYYQNFDVVRLGWIAYPMMKNFSAWAFLIWVFFFGASLGSFLNVFAYRVP
ncbi:MAG: hypothetical protein VX438_12725, partial [Planctomycetota bacterium]|nr:hypothetical protein [Planctomycetota bacterium]